MIQSAAPSLSSSLALSSGPQATPGDEAAISAGFAAVLGSTLAPAREALGADARNPEEVTGLPTRQPRGNLPGKKLPSDLPEGEIAQAEAGKPADSDAEIPTEKLPVVRSEIILPGLVIPVVMPVLQADRPLPAPAPQEWAPADKPVQAAAAPLVPAPVVAAESKPTAPTPACTTTIPALVASRLPIVLANRTSPGVSPLLPASAMTAPAADAALDVKPAAPAPVAAAALPVASVVSASPASFTRSLVIALPKAWLNTPLPLTDANARAPESMPAMVSFAAPRTGAGIAEVDQTPVAAPTLNSTTDISLAGQVAPTEPESLASASTPVARPIFVMPASAAAKPGATAKIDLAITTAVITPASAAAPEAPSRPLLADAAAPSIASPAPGVLVPASATPGARPPLARVLTAELASSLAQPELENAGKPVAVSAQPPTSQPGSITGVPLQAASIGAPTVPSAEVSSPTPANLPSNQPPQPAAAPVVVSASEQKHQPVELEIGEAKAVAPVVASASVQDPERAGREIGEAKVAAPAPTAPRTHQASVAESAGPKPAQISATGEVSASPARAQASAVQDPERAGREIGEAKVAAPAPTAPRTHQASVAESAGPKPAQTSATGEVSATPARAQASAQPQPAAPVADAQTFAQGIGPVTAAPVTTAPANPSGAHGAGHDFATLVERLVEARTAAMPQAIQASIAHSEFGQVSLRFEQDAGSLSVAMSSPDPDFARAVQASAASAQAQTASDNGSNTPRQDASGQQQQQQGAGSASGQAQSQPQPQSQSQSSARQDRGQPAQTATIRSGSTAGQQQQDDDAADTHGDIYA